jgi:hypothetical protein
MHPVLLGGKKNGVVLITKQKLLPRASVITSLLSVFYNVYVLKKISQNDLICCIIIIYTELGYYIWECMSADYTYYLLGSNSQKMNYVDDN